MSNGRNLRLKHRRQECSMTQQQLQSVNNGQSVTITDSQVSGHTHNYTITKWF